MGFKYQPLTYVRVTLFGLDYQGRVIRCIFDGGQAMYDVDFAINGELRRREFYEDEITKA